MKPYESLARSTLLLVVMACVQCGSETTDVSSARVDAAVAASAPMEVQKIWSENRRVLQDSLVESVPLDKYMLALAFFEETTGIKSIAAYSYVGRMPSRDLEGDLKKWDDWYQQNAQLLYLDSVGKIKRRSAQ